jgi:hypothetical protein
MRELTSTFGVGAGAGGGSALRDECRECTLFAMSNDGIFGGVVNVA